MASSTNSSQPAGVGPSVQTAGNASVNSAVASTTAQPYAPVTVLGHIYSAISRPLTFTTTANVRSSLDAGASVCATWTVRLADMTALEHMRAVWPIASLDGPLELEIAFGAIAQGATVRVVAGLMSSTAVAADVASVAAIVGPGGVVQTFSVPPHPQVAPPPVRLMLGPAVGASPQLWPEPAGGVTSSPRLVVMAQFQTAFELGHNQTGGQSTFVYSTAMTIAGSLRVRADPSVVF